MVKKVFILQCIQKNKDLRYYLRMQELQVKLPEYSGPLEVLTALVQRKEIDVDALEIRTILLQLLEHLQNKVDTAHLPVESIGQTGLLILLKSRALLPQEKGATDEELIQLFDVNTLDQLLHYYQFRAAAQELSTIEDREPDSYARPFSPFEPPERGSGIDHVSLEGFALLFHEVLKKAKNATGKILEEEWKVSDKIRWLRAKLKEAVEIEFSEIFHSELSKMELIVIFLAVLELMKLGELIFEQNAERTFLYQPSRSAKGTFSTDA